MRSRASAATVAAVALALAVSWPALGHSGEEASAISVDPPTVTAGGSVVLAGTGLEADNDREISLVGPDVVVPFPTVTTDTDGMFDVTLTIPAHLPAGIYTFQAVADETLTVQLTVTAAAGQAAPEPKNEASATIVPRDRSGIELGIVALVIAISVVGGALLILRAERFGHAT